MTALVSLSLPSVRWSHTELAGVCPGSRVGCSRPQRGGVPGVGAEPHTLPRNGQGEKAKPGPGDAYRALRSNRVTGLESLGGFHKWCRINIREKENLKTRVMSHL